MTTVRVNAGSLPQTPSPRDAPGQGCPGGRPFYGCHAGAHTQEALRVTGAVSLGGEGLLPRARPCLPGRSRLQPDLSPTCRTPWTRLGLKRYCCRRMLLCPRGPDREAAQLRSPGEVSPRCRRGRLTHGLFPSGVWGRSSRLGLTALLAWVFLSGKNCLVNHGGLPRSPNSWSGFVGCPAGSWGSTWCPRPARPRRGGWAFHTGVLSTAPFLCGRLAPQKTQMSRVLGVGAPASHSCSGCLFSREQRSPLPPPASNAPDFLRSEWSAPCGHSCASSEVAATRSFQAPPTAGRQLHSTPETPQQVGGALRAALLGICSEWALSAQALNALP